MTDSSSAPSAALLHLAVGRLARDKLTHEFDASQHTLIASDLDSRSASLEQTKAIKAHLIAIMKKGSHKLLPDKRIRLLSEENNYECHILTASLDEDNDERLIVFFAVTCIDFAKLSASSVGTLLKELRDGVIDSCGAQTLWSAKTVNKSVQPLLEQLHRQYGNSALQSVQAKVDSVREIMQNSVAKSLGQVEKLEDMEDSAAQLEERSTVFQKKAKKIHAIQKSSYRKICCLVICVILFLLIGLIAVYGFKLSTKDVTQLITGSGKVSSSSTASPFIVDFSSTGLPEPVPTPPDG